MMRVRRLLAVLVFGAAFAAGAQAQAYEPSWLAPREDRATMEGVQARLLTSREVIAIVQSQRGGSCLNVRAGPVEGPNGWYYVLSWRYPNGSVEDLRVDAVTGRVLGR